MTNTIHNVPRELLCELRDAANEGMNATTRQHQIDYFAGLIAKADALLSAPSPANHVDDVRAMVAATSPAGVDGLEVETYLHTMHMEIGQTRQFCSKWKGDPFGIAGEDYSSTYSVTSEPLCRLSDAQAIIDGLRVEVARLREDRDSFQRIGIRQIEHRYQLAALLLEKFPRIDPHHPITLSEVDHCCEYVLHKDRERLHCAIDAALSAGKEGE